MFGVSVVMLPAGNSRGNSRKISGVSFPGMVPNPAGMTTNPQSPLSKAFSIRRFPYDFRFSVI